MQRLDTYLLLAGYTEIVDGEPMTVNTDMATVVKAMAAPDSGLDIRDRMWLKITIPNAFIGKMIDLCSRSLDWNDDSSSSSSIIKVIMMCGLYYQRYYVTKAYLPIIMTTIKLSWHHFNHCHHHHHPTSLRLS